MKKILILMFAFVFSCAGFSGDGNIIAEKAVKAANKYWRGDHWGSKKISIQDSKYLEPHMFALMAWTVVDARLNGKNDKFNRVFKHFNSIGKQFWSDKLNRYMTGYDFLSNAVIGISLALSYEHGKDFMSEKEKKDILSKLQGIADYLPPLSTAPNGLRHDPGALRACNQDAFQAYALSIIARVLKDPKIRKNALMVFHRILNCSEQSFWTEGGIDIGYQGIGEPAFAAAADILWDDLTRKEKIRVADLMMRPRVSGGFALENCRSPSSLSPHLQSGAMAYLNRVSNPFIAKDVEAHCRMVVNRGFPTKWWLTDSSAISLMVNAATNNKQIKEISKLPDDYAWGSLARLIMPVDEYNGKNGGMEKAYLIGQSGMTAIFGDNRRVNPKTALNLFGLTEPQKFHNPSGLRYLGWKSHCFIWPDDKMGYPRLCAGAINADAQVDFRKMYPGFCASIYQLRQSIPVKKGISSEIKQIYTVINHVFLAIFIGDESSKPQMSFDITLPVEEFNVAENTAWIKQKNLVPPHQSFRRLGIVGFNSEKMIMSRETYKPYLKKPIIFLGNKVNPPKELRKISIPFKKNSSIIAFLHDLPNNAVQRWLKQAVFEDKPDYLSLRYQIAGKEYFVFVPKKEIASINLTFKKNRNVNIIKPKPFFAHIFCFQGNKLQGMTSLADAVSYNQQQVFYGGSGTFVSFLDNGSYQLYEIKGTANIKMAKSKKAMSLIDNSPVIMPGQVKDDRLIVR